MKKNLILLCLLMACFSVYAQKSYVNVVVHFEGITTSKVSLSGDIPSGIETRYDIGTILNMLSEKGFEVEFMGETGGSSNVIYLLSKKTSSYNAVRSVQIDDEDVTEVARYNLQGMPIDESEKGVQIIVFSNCVNFS